MAATLLAALAYSVLLLALLAWWLRAVRGARKDAALELPRHHALAAALLLAALGALAALAFGCMPARAAPAAAAPRARLFLRHVTVDAPLWRALGLGSGAGSALHMPASTAPARWIDLVATPAGLFGWAAAGATDRVAVVTLSATPPPESAAAAAREHATACRRPLSAGASSAAGALIVYSCTDAGNAREALLIEIGDVDVSTARAALRVTPLRREGGRYLPHHIEVQDGALLHIGSEESVAPGAPAAPFWAVPAPAGSFQLFYSPNDVTRACQEEQTVCALSGTAPFALELRRLLPDVAGVSARSGWSAAMVIAPVLFLFLFGAAGRRGDLTSERMARTLGLAFAAAGLAAVLATRQLWAHRIDMLREFQSVGVRVAENLFLTVLASAALAAAAAAAWRPTRPLLCACAAWLVTVLIGGAALGPWADGSRLPALLSLSLAVGSAPIWLPMGWRKLPRFLHASPIRGLLALFAAAAAACVLAPRAVALKLLFAWLLAQLAYAAVRRPQSARSAAAAVAALALAVAALAWFDPGVTAAVAFPGLALALLLAAHDSGYVDAEGRYLSAWERHHAPLVAAHAAIAAAAALLLAWAASAQESAELAASLLRAAGAGALLLAVLLAPVVIVGYRRGGFARALPWLAGAVAALALFAARDQLAAALLSSDTEAAHRVALVTEPGHALLRDPTRFAAGVAALGEVASAAGPSGEGYFGARLFDPGVLLSVDNDYLPVLVARELGAVGVAVTAIPLFLLALGGWLAAEPRYRVGSAAARRRMLAAAMLGAVATYQPLAALGVLPLTGIAWPGLGIDSPSDFFIFLAIAMGVCALPPSDGEATELDRFDAELRRTRRYRRLRHLSAASAALAAAAGLFLIGRSAALALERRLVAPSGGPALAGVLPAIDYARSLRCPSSAQNGSAEELVPSALAGAPAHRDAMRFHLALSAAWGRERSAAVRTLAAFLRDGGGCERGARGHWSWAVEADGQECHLVYAAGWPEIHLRVVREEGANGRGSARCEVELASISLAALGLAAPAPPRERARLLSRALGAAARDIGELVSARGGAIRLRPGAGEALEPKWRGRRRARHFGQRRARRSARRPGTAQPGHPGEGAAFRAARRR
jgi:hypothetical protein